MIHAFPIAPDFMPDRSIAGQPVFVGQALERRPLGWHKLGHPVRSVVCDWLAVDRYLRLESNL